MKRTYVVMTVTAAVLAGAGASLATSAQGIATARAGRSAKVTLRHTRLGQILATASGFTLYEFTRDRTNQNVCVTISGCSETWRALQTSGRPTAGPGVRASLLSTTRLPGGKTQVTYAGHPLYTYTADSGPGETSYVGEKVFGGRWYALTSAGRIVK